MYFSIYLFYFIIIVLWYVMFNLIKFNIYIYFFFSYSWSFELYIYSLYELMDTTTNSFCVCALLASKAHLIQIKCINHSFSKVLLPHKLNLETIKWNFVQMLYEKI